MAKYGRRHVISEDPLAFNIGIVGEPGIGKSTLLKEYCEKLAGPDGYMMLDIGREDGHDAIHDIVSEKIEDWDKLVSVIDDVVANRQTDYKDLRIVVFDTFDELCTIADVETIRRWNEVDREDKTATPITSIKATYGGFQGGEGQSVDMILDIIWKLKRAGVAFAITGHTKTREVLDPLTGKTYVTLTTNAPGKYFNAIKTKLHLLGVASIDRDIVRERTEQKDFTTKKFKERGRVSKESRTVTFRDDNYTIDSKSRFAHIIDSIPLDSDELIKAVKDALYAARGEMTEEKKELITLIAHIDDAVKTVKQNGATREDIIGAFNSVQGCPLNYNNIKDTKVAAAALEAVKNIKKKVEDD